MRSVKNLVIGGGVSGFAFAQRLNQLGEDDVLLIEKSGVIGGKAQTIKRRGFTFDIGGHWLHCQDNEWFAEEFDLKPGKRQAWIRMDGKMIPYPIQNHLDELRNTELIKKQLESNDSAAFPEPQNYREMLVQRYGPELCKQFFFPYNTKLFGRKLSTVPIADELIFKRNVQVGSSGYNADFYYPETGGIQQIVEQMTENVFYQTRHNLTFVDIENKVATVEPRTGNLRDRPEQIQYDHLISTIPLRNFTSLSNLDVILNPPHSSLWLWLLGVKHKPSHDNKTWVYVPNTEFTTFRYGFFNNVRPDMAPEGYSSVYVEIDGSKQFNREDAVLELVKLGVIDSIHDIEINLSRYIHVNYPLKSEFVDDVVKYLATKDVITIGRYGEWRWSSIHEDIMDARAKATKLYRDQYQLTEVE